MIKLGNLNSLIEMCSIDTYYIIVYNMKKILQSVSIWKNKTDLSFGKQKKIYIYV